MDAAEVTHMPTAEAVNPNAGSFAPTPIAAPPTPRVIDRIRAAFFDTSWSLDVPEWGTTLYFRPMTVADLEIVSSQIPQVTTAGEAAPSSVESAYERNLRLLIHKAKDASGSPVFLPGDLHYLKTEARVSTIQRVVNFMFACGSLSPKEGEDAVKN